VLTVLVAAVAAAAAGLGVVVLGVGAWARSMQRRYPTAVVTASCAACGSRGGAVLPSGLQRAEEVCTRCGSASVVTRGGAATPVDPSGSTLSR
jgi:hypothetical protein